MKTDAELNQLIAERVIFNCPTEQRLCSPDPDSGAWCEVQSYYPDLEVGDPIWSDTAELLPCYNWLDSSEPKANGWSIDEIAETNAEFRDLYWKVILDYCTDPAARESLIDHLIEQDYAVTLYARHRLRSAELLHAPTHSRIRKDDSTEIGRALVLATLAAYGVEVEE